MDSRHVSLTLILVICALIPGCTTISDNSSPGDVTNLTGTTWHLSSYNVGHRTLDPVGPETNITLTFSDGGNVSGYLDGCREYLGHFTNAGETITITNLTEVNEGTCPLSQETVKMKNNYFALLEKSSRFGMSEDTLDFGYFDVEKYLVFNRT